MSTSRGTSTADLGEGRGIFGADRLASAIKRRWKRGEPPDLAGALAVHPELQGYRSVVLDLAYTEYRLRLEAGESLDAERFSRRFPSLERSLHLLIEVHGLLSQDPELKNLQDTLPWPEAGSRFLQFDLIAEIGRGAFGQVFLATEPALGDRHIVVKIAPHAGGEAETLGKLQHPNIVPIYSLHEDESTGLAAFCMPYLGRATLGDVLEQAFAGGGPPLRAKVILDAVSAVNRDSDSPELPPPASCLRRGSYVDGVVHVAAQIAEALAHSHGRGIYHRDLKPSNVLMTSDGRPLLLDFNLSVRTGLPAWKIGGTLPYMAPEELDRLVQKKRDSAVWHYDPRSDVFSLGVIVYELLAGELPFGKISWNRPLEEIARQLRQRQQGGPRPIRARNSQVDRRLARLVESCLAPDPRRRPESAEQLAKALRRELSLVRRGRRWMGNHRKLVVGTGTVLLGLTLAAAAFLAMRPPYDVRRLQLGLAHHQRGEYASAVDCLNDAIRAGPASAEALFARGRAYQKLNEFELAYKDYSAARQLAPTPIIDACRGYCLSGMKIHKLAIEAYRLALEAGYGAPAILHNNIGYSHLMLAQIGKAEEQLRRAVDLDDKLQAAHCNMVNVFLQRALQGEPVPKAAFTHIARALEAGPCGADFYRNAATLCAIAAKQDSVLIQPAIEYVAKAVELGVKPQLFASDARYSALQKAPTFGSALQRPASLQKPSKTVRLLDPLDGP